MLSWCPRLNRIENPKTCQVPSHHQPCRLPHRHMIASSTHTPTMKELDPEIRSCSCRSGPWIRLHLSTYPRCPPIKSPIPLYILDRTEEHHTKLHVQPHTLLSTMSSPPSRQPTRFLLPMLLLPFDVIPRSKQANRLPKTGHITSACARTAIADQWTSIHVTLPWARLSTQALTFQRLPVSVDGIVRAAVEVGFY